MKKAIFFIEGIEHLRFVKPYLYLFEKYKLNIEVVSFEDLQIENTKTKIISKKDFNEYCINLNAEYLITTTPGVGNSYFLKSKVFPKSRRPKYIYVFHSLVSPNEAYSRRSFVGFDYIFSPNEIITNQLKFLTKDRTKIFTTGYPLLTNKYYFEEKLKTNMKKILIAPSWGEFNLFKDIDLLKNLLEICGLNYEIYLRPHPMEKLNINSFESFNNVQIDLNKDMKSLVYYDYLITDWSGIGIEYSILTNKKTIYLNTVKKKRKKLSFSEKKLVLIEDEIRKTAGIEIKLEKLNDINKYLDSDITISDNSYINSIKEPEFNSDKFEFLFK
jgi:hypothetical protein|tara:strand:- start:1136 stop:2122 length:987 start_codon:yes stop_codon:yes gene_type:complete